MPDDRIISDYFTDDLPLEAEAAAWAMQEEMFRFIGRQARGEDAHETLGDMVRRVLETVEAAKDSGDLGLYVLSFYRDPEED